LVGLVVASDTPVTESTFIHLIFLAMVARLLFFYLFSQTVYGVLIATAPLS